MWDNDCGALPVLDEKGAPVGIVTDRDICMASARRNRFPGDIAVREAMSPHPFVCKPEDDILAALSTMAARQVRRLPVVNREGSLVGIISISDVAAAARSGRRSAAGADATHRMAAETLEKICAPRTADEVATV